MRAYIISLKDRHHPDNAALAARLEALGLDIEFVDAVYGPSLNAKAYFSAVHTYFMATKRWMTPSELGCTLSHKKVYESILESGDARALVFEDDVLLGDSEGKLTRVMELAAHFDGYLHLGGQQGLDSFLQVRGALVHTTPPVFRVDLRDIRRMHRTVGYVLSSEAARKILAVIDSHAFAIDDFAYISKHAGLTDFYYSDVVAHPFELGASSIEGERKAIRPPNGEPRLVARLINEIRSAVRFRLNLLMIRFQPNQRIVAQLKGMGRP
jgi:glycosyl transferase, family 25